MNSEQVEADFPAFQHIAHIVYADLALLYYIYNYIKSRLFSSQLSLWGKSLIIIGSGRARETFFYVEHVGVR